MCSIETLYQSPMQKQDRLKRYGLLTCGPGSAWQDLCTRTGRHIQPET